MANLEHERNDWTNREFTTLKICHSRSNVRFLSDASERNVSPLHSLHHFQRNLRFDQGSDRTPAFRYFFPKKYGSACVKRSHLQHLRIIYFDDMLVFGENDDAFILNVKTVFQQCTEKKVTLNAKKLVIGFDTVPFVGHEINATGITCPKNV